MIHKSNLAKYIKQIHLYFMFVHNKYLCVALNNSLIGFCLR